MIFVFLVSFSFISDASASGAFPVNDESSVIGLIEQYTVKENESLHEIARAFDLGYNEIEDANPDVEPFVPGKGRTIIIPSEWILPDGNNEGIIINIAEFRLYYFVKTKGGRFVKTYPIGLGRKGFETPLGRYTITQKIKSPSWTPPPSIREEKPSLPPVVGPGADNPLGAYALRLSNPLILLHGTHKPLGVGRRVSHGCIRLYPEDIENLFPSVKVNTHVSIIYQPVKIGLKDGIVYAEVHEDYMGKMEDQMTEAIEILTKKNLMDKADNETLKRALEEKNGVPTPISINHESHSRVSN
jgi:L,D-transpeptidase ErfK/SrfK